jgi:hypothetical protein
MALKQLQLIIRGRVRGVLSRFTQREAKRPRSAAG